MTGLGVIDYIVLRTTTLSLDPFFLRGLLFGAGTDGTDRDRISQRLTSKIIDPKHQRLASDPRYTTTHTK